MATPTINRGTGVSRPPDRETACGLREGQGAGWPDAVGPGGEEAVAIPSHGTATTNDSAELKPGRSIRPRLGALRPCRCRAVAYAARRRRQARQAAPAATSSSVPGSAVSVAPP